MASLDLQQGTRQQPNLSPRLQRAVRLLQLSSLDFASTIHEALDRNPFLEVVEPGDTDDARAGAAASAPVTAPVTAPMTATITAAISDDTHDSTPEDDNAAAPVTAAPLLPVQEAGVIEPPDDDRDLWHSDALAAAGPRSSEGEVSALDLAPAESSMSAHLHGQLNLMTLPERDLALAKAIVESLDDDGYLRIDLSELASITDLSPPTSIKEMQIALRLVQSLEPAGVAARNLSECLTLQLPSIDCPRLRELAHDIIQAHLPALAARDVTGLARRLGRKPAEVEAACTRIRRFDPRPGWRFGAAPVRYVMPDVVLKKSAGRWQVRLNPAIVPRVRLNHVYAELCLRHRAAQDGELMGYLQEARWTLRNVEQRFSTILSVAEAIVRRQKLFFELGPIAMKPLALREVADELGLHESTVSRATSNKYMSTPTGLFEFKHFFSRPMLNANGGGSTGTALRELLRETILGEGHGQPLSDAQISRLLAQQGLMVARRTVTKYRQLMRIDPVELRRRAHTSG